MRWTLAIIVVLLPRLVLADTFLLRNGGTIEGTILQRPVGDGPDANYTVRVDDGIVVQIAANRVGRVAEVTDAERQYDKLLAHMPNTTQGHATMAQWCHNHELRAERDFHWQEVLRGDSNNAEARRALGYNRVRGEWVRPDEYMRSQGYQLINGKWQLPQQAAVKERQLQTELTEKKIRKDLRTWRGWLGGRRHDEAVQRILEVRDPLAATGLRDLLRSERDVEVRHLYAECLSRLATAAAIDGLIEVALQDNDSDLRLKSIEYLQATGSDRAGAAFANALGSGNTTTINRAAVALARLNYTEAVPALMNVLVTRHETTVAPPPGSMQASFGGTSDGGTGINGFSAGGGPKKIVQNSKNKAVLEALIALTGQNYQYSIPEWKTWYVSKNSLPDTVNLRRD